MGQSQSVPSQEDQSNQTSSTAAPLQNSPSQPPSSLDSLISEAAAYGSQDANDSMESKAQKALECPCIAHLRSGPCGAPFSDAFLCFLKSTAEEKGSDCVHPFVALQNCIKANPDAFSSDVLDDDDEAKQGEKPST